ncbi:MAG: hypothetical protein HFH68_13190 [Lachnospiraceae bacterium]|nr:hypothetical protein [Lachnospiraceae bacterium]
MARKVGLFTVRGDDEEPDEKYIIPDSDIDLEDNYVNEQVYDNNYNDISYHQPIINNEFIIDEIEKDIIKQTILPQIWIDETGTICYTLNTPDIYNTRQLPLLNVYGYQTYLYSSEYKKSKQILIVKCIIISSNTKNAICIIFNYDKKIKGKDFIQTLIASGITLLSAGRYRNNLADALLSYSINHAEKLEIPYSYGWWKKSDLKWKFAGKNDLTIKYIQENKTDQIKTEIPCENSYDINDYTSNEQKFLILISLAVNYPVLKEYGMELSKPLFVVVDKGQMKAAIDILADRDTSKLHSSIKKRELVKIMTETNSDFVVYPYIQSKKSDEFLSVINDIVLAGEIDGNKINAMPVIISENFPYGYDMENFFTVCIEGSLDDIYINKIAVVPPDEDLVIVKDKIDNEIASSFSHNEKALMAAVYFLYPNFKHEIVNYQTLAIKLIEENDNNYDANSLEYFFIEELFNWQKKTGFHNISQLPYPANNALENMKNTIFFDEDYVYMHENIFKEITKKFENIISINRLKKKLDDEGILYKENTNTYTVKMCYYKNEILNRNRMLRFYRSKLYKGETGFIEACQYIEAYQ